ncbi:hypothetical protein F4813DRAFT_139772 [Daldinia decipiens]|uniref:uncharacterized protein n=1 Tax=Daldinia decipiens TaxID=326647 RepID=UPI0020C29F06|nr:uncharacterized protein F4813DRAFT_139772 [Daldinia decipiens]KAI1656250.1 hypothetical protein F4813DRAFT_139772 [Daldinia decipiens]
MYLVIMALASISLFGPQSLTRKDLPIGLTYASSYRTIIICASGYFKLPALCVTQGTYAYLNPSKSMEANPLVPTSQRAAIGSCSCPLPADQSRHTTF